MSDEKLSKAEYFIQQLNVVNAKRFAFLIVLFFSSGFSFFHLLYGNDSCAYLLADGRFKGDLKQWQCYGCMTHAYSLRDTRRCLRYLAFYGQQNHFVFIGDYRIKNLCEAFINHFQQSSKLVEEKNFSDEKNPQNLEYVDYKLRLRVNCTLANDVSPTMLREFEKYLSEQDPPSFIITSSKFLNFNAKDRKYENQTKELEKSFTKNLTLLVKSLDKLVEKDTKVVWKLQDPINDNLDQDKLPLEWRDVVNSDIEKYNRVVKNILSYSKARIWESSKKIAYGLMDDDMIDGHLLGARALSIDIQILLNIYCNDNMAWNDGTCCSSSENYTILQILTYAFFGVSMILATVILLRRWYMRMKGHTLYMPLQQTEFENSTSLKSNGELVIALGTLGLIMLYFYICDRTNFFMKENKYYSEFSFWIPVFWLFALGLFFTEDSKFTKVLHRDQTDEMKGWMIIVILIYYMVGASKVIPIYMHIKVLISTYLFICGYSQFSYFWQTGNGSLVRFLNVMFRYNFLTIVLCFCMNRPYQFYFFAPLLTFWYSILYLAICVIPPRITAHNCDNNNYHYLYLVLKFIGILSVITILYLSEVFFERIFLTRPWKALFVTTDDDIHEWWFRWKLDRYSATFGMIFAAIFIVAQKFNIVVDDNNHGNLFSRRISLSLTLLSCVGIGFYTTYTFFCKNKQDCEEIHSYVVFIPITSYIIMRNISGILRTRFSTLFAWFGKISLELFICQCHIWLAADRHGVLVLLPGFPTLNIIITSYIFVCIAHELHRLTVILAGFFIPSDWKLAVRNFVLFLLILAPIGRHDRLF